MSSASTVRSLPTSTLLGLLLGDDAAEALAGRPLVDLFALHAGTPVLREGEADYHTVTVIDAAKELVARALHEQMRQVDCLSTPNSVRDYLRLRFADRPHEVFAVLLLDSQNQLIADSELFRGTLTQTSVYPREVVKLALQYNAAAVLFAHNHPSGVPDPSQADLCLTRSLKDALALVEVRVLDHFVIAGNLPPVSFAERGLI